MLFRNLQSSSLAHSDEGRIENNELVSCSQQFREAEELQPRNSCSRDVSFRFLTKLPSSSNLRYRSRSLHRRKRGREREREREKESQRSGGVELPREFVPRESCIFSAIVESHGEGGERSGGRTHDRELGWNVFSISVETTTTDV